jgi:hypothetical protein
VIIAKLAYLGTAVVIDAKLPVLVWSGAAAVCGLASLTWINNLRPHAPHPFKLESFNEPYHAARKLNDDLAVVSLLLTQKATVDGVDRTGDFYEVDIWKRNGGKWQIIARYSAPIPQTTAGNAPNK